MKQVSVDVRKMLMANTPTAGMEYAINTEPDRNAVNSEGAPLENVITIYDLGGPAQDPKNNIDEAMIQFRARNLDSADAWTALNNIKLFLEGLTADILYADSNVDKAELFDNDEDAMSFVVNDSMYTGFWSETNIMFLMKDVKEFYFYTYGMQVVRSPLVSGNRR